MHKIKACSILMMAGALVACGKDKQAEPMTPAAGPKADPRMQTDPAWQEQQAPMQPQQAPPPGEWQPETQGPTGEQPAATEWGTPAPQTGSMEARTLAESRCKRELRCNNIGDTKKYPSVEECQATLLTEGDQLLASCPSGISSEAMTECTKAVEAKACNKPMGKLTEFEECRMTVLCAQ